MNPTDTELSAITDRLDIRELLDIAEQAHNACDTDSDTTCHAEQYGDGSAAQHALIRRVQAALDRGKRPPQPDYSGVTDRQFNRSTNNGSLYG